MLTGACWLRVGAIVFLSLVALPARVQDVPLDRQPIENLGILECRYWPPITGPASTVQLVKVNWLYGYVEGVSMENIRLSKLQPSLDEQKDSRFPLPVTLNLAELAGRVDDYCHAHPGAFVSDAVTATAKQTLP